MNDWLRREPPSGQAEQRGVALQFQCRLLSPFHTTRLPPYASLWKCAPFILGSTLRGALLQHLITSTYSPAAIKELARLNDPLEIARFHQRFEQAGPVRAFFTEPPGARFSFGLFSDDVTMKYQALTRIALERQFGSAAEGKIVNVEMIEAGAAFGFEILVPGDEGELAEVIETGVRQMSETVGLGGLRSIGLGQFEVTEVKRLALAERMDQAAGEIQLADDDERRSIIRFDTPYVLANGNAPWAAGPAQLAAQLSGQVRQALTAAGMSIDAGALNVARVEAHLRPEFIGRWSYESGGRQNRLVAWPGSELTLCLAERPANLREQLAIASLFGIGEWSEFGFGRFEVLPA